MRILLIEDSKDILFLMRMELEAMGYTVLTARDGASGLETAKRERPDLIISDIKMPGLNGVELIKQLRSIPELAATPSIALTGYAEQELEDGTTAGYDAHVSKPVDPNELSELIQKLVSGKAGPVGFKPATNGL